jgi:colicin import membrane protein
LQAAKVKAEAEAAKAAKEKADREAAEAKAKAEKEARLQAEIKAQIAAKELADNKAKVQPPSIFRKSCSAHATTDLMCASQALAARPLSGTLTFTLVAAKGIAGSSNTRDCTRGAATT